MHPIDCFVPVGNVRTLGEAFGANQPLALEQKLEGAVLGNAPRLEVSVVRLEGRPGRLFVLKHLRARCDQALSAYRTFFVGAAGYRSRIFIQPAEMNPEGVPRCNSLYTVSFYVDGDVSEISYRGDFYGDPSSTFETIWALDWTHTATLGSAIACAKGVVLPANFMQSGQTNPLPKASPATAPAKAGKKSALPWVLGAAAVGGLAWWAWSSSALAGLGVASNPDVSKAASTAWERAYREALRAGAKKGEAEEYAQEALRAYQDDELNRLGGALDRPEDYDYSNPRDRTDTVNAIVRKAGWSFDLAMSALKSDGAARWHNDLLYVLTNYAGDPPSNPREPMVVGVYALDERAGEWIDVGQKDFTNLRNALQRWNTVQVDMTVVRELGTGPFKPNPGRAQKLGLRPSDVDPRELARGTKHELEHTDSERVARQIAMDHLSEDEAYYEKLDAMERGTFRSNPKHRYRILDGAGGVSWEGDNLKEARAALARVRGHTYGGLAVLQFYDPGTADSPGDWFNYRERA